MQRVRLFVRNGGQRLMLLAFVAAALASAGVGLPKLVDLVQDLHAAYEGLSRYQRDQAPLSASNIPSSSWDFIRQHLGEGERYAIETPPAQGASFNRLMRTVAGYWLLPSVAVKNADAEVVIYLDVRGPPGATCLEQPVIVCVLRRD